MSKRKPEKPYKRPLIVIAVMFLLSGLFLTMYLIRTETVRVEGNSYVTGELIKSAVFPDNDEKRLFYVLVKRLLGIPAVPGLKKVRVSPSSLKSCVIRVTEEEAVCQVFDGTFYDVLTAEGIVLTRLQEPAEGLVELKGVKVKDAAVLSALSSYDDEALMTGLLYAVRFIENEIPVSYLTVSSDGCSARIDQVTVLLGNGFGATEKVNEIRAQYPVYKGLSGVLHMEEFYLESGNVRVYFEVGEEMMTSGEEEEEEGTQN